MTAPSLDDVLVAFSIARSDLAKLESEARGVYDKLEDLQRVIREKRALVSRLRAEAVGLLPDVKEGES